MNELLRSLTNRIAREGMSGRNSMDLRIVLDTLLYMEDIDAVPVVDVQTLLLLLEDCEIPATEKRMAAELRSRLIRAALGPDWMHGVPVIQYPLNVMNHSIVTKVENITVYEDGAVTAETLGSVHDKNIPAERILINDFAQAALNQ